MLLERVVVHGVGKPCVFAHELDASLLGLRERLILRLGSLVDPLGVRQVGLERTAFDLQVVLIAVVALVDDGRSGLGAWVGAEVPSMSAVYKDRINKYI